MASLQYAFSFYYAGFSVYSARNDATSVRCAISSRCSVSASARVCCVCIYYFYESHCPSCGSARSLFINISSRAACVHTRVYALYKVCVYTLVCVCVCYVLAILRARSSQSVQRSAAHTRRREGIQQFINKQTHQSTRNSSAVRCTKTHQLPELRALTANAPRSFSLCRAPMRTHIHTNIHTTQHNTTVQRTIAVSYAILVLSYTDTTNTTAADSKS